MFSIIATEHNPNRHQVLATSLPTEIEAKVQAQGLSYGRHAEFKCVGVYDAQGKCVHLFEGGRACL